MDSEDYVNGQSIRIRFEDGTEPIQGDTVSYMRPRNNKIVETIDRVDTAFTLGDVFLAIPRFISSFF